MIIDGETYACEGCIRGHRTRNCQHNDRPLHLISKKGRPVSQCNHCRSQRKSRSAHVKCECGKRPDGTGGCGCHEGGRCTCATKKSPKQEQQQTPKTENLPEFAATESLGAPAISDPTLSNPAQITSSSGLNWQDMASPMSGYSMEGTGPNHFDQNAWQQGNQQMQHPSSAMHDQTFSGNFMAYGTDRDPNTHDLGINTAPYNDQFDAPLDMSYNMNDWPSMDSDATKEFLGMLDSSQADLGLSTNDGWDTSNLFPMAGGHESSDMMFGATNDAPAGQQTNEKKGCGGGSQCCS